MGNPRGFINVKRGEGGIRDQASRCMDCGTPFCNWACPLGNYIPEWNDEAYLSHFEHAYQLLAGTNNLPEITGRVCPALCEFSCVLGLNDEPVTIRENELAIIETAFKQGWVKPRPPKTRTGKSVAVVGSGPAGLSCADELNKLGHSVAVFEKDDKPGGIMRYGIPDFKLEKNILDRRIELFEKEGIEFKLGKEAGPDLIRQGFDAVCLATGARTPRDLKIPGRDLIGIHFAMDYLTRSNRGERNEARGKRVVVIGGGDTGADCVGTAIRQGAKCMLQIELLPKPPEVRPESQPWPVYPLILKTPTSYEEGCERQWSISTKEFKGKGKRVGGLKCVKVDGSLKEIPGSEFKIDADLVVLALGFLRPAIKVEEKGVFLAGDVRRGPSLIVWAILEGRQAAEAIDRYLKEKK
jgi:glutamate synthase (NADPH/NADH) small chain